MCYYNINKKTTNQINQEETLRTAEDRAYAIKCAVGDIMSEEEEEITDEYLDMLDMTYC